MPDATARRCDICAEVIPRGAPYRIGHTTPDAAAEAFTDAEPAARVVGTMTAEGFVRLEVCKACARAVGLSLIPHEAVDTLH